MRCGIIKNYETEIKKYCIESGLSYSKLIDSSLSWNNDSVFVLYNSHDPEREALGMMDDIPMPITLEIYLENGKLRFEQTDITRKYLGVEKENPVPHTITRPVRPSIHKRRRDLAYA